MAKIPFKVSSRTARLLGRENVARADGAIIELVKNTYDADAKICILYFRNPYHEIPSRLSMKDYTKFSNETYESKLISKSYQLSPQGPKLIADLSSKDISQLQAFFRSKTSLYIIDNGDGMTKEVIENHWMIIGTDHKLNDFTTGKGRIKSGAKGIGRFALDRLGNNCEMITLPKDQSAGFKWTVDWSDFEKKGTLQEIEADLVEVKGMNYQTEIFSLIENKRVEELVQSNSADFAHGTILKIEELRDDWTTRAIDKIYENLEVLTPPDGAKGFDIHIITENKSERFDQYGKVQNEHFDDYDYKVEAKFLNDEEQNVWIQITRNEIDLQKLRKDKEVFKYEAMQKEPYDEETIFNRIFSYQIPVWQLKQGPSKENPFIDELGPFSFTFYFLKIGTRNKEDEEKYLYKSFNKASRKRWQEKFNGIKIFRDDFRVRPYGEIGNNAFDWLGLSPRGANPPAVSRKGAWRVSPERLVGSINISRIYNLKLQDKSSREGFQESEVFNLLQSIIIGIIREFEDDRSYIAYHLEKVFKERDDDKKDKAKLEERVAIAQVRKIINTQRKAQQETAATSRPLKVEEVETLEKTIETFQRNAKQQEASFKKQIEEKEDEARLLRALASEGLLISGFSHEFGRIKTKLNKRTRHLRKYIRKLISEEVLNTLKDHENPLKIVDEVEEIDKKLVQWINFSLNIVRKSKRIRKDIYLVKYFQSFEKEWKNLLEGRNCRLNISITELLDKESFTIEAIEMDLDIIFENLITNSIEAFQKPNSSPKREILIELDQTEEEVIITYIDSGGGLSEEIRRPEDIFEPFVTTKKDSSGNPNGTGLGMYLLKTTLDEYDAQYELLLLAGKFGIEIRLAK